MFTWLEGKPPYYGRRASIISLYRWSQNFDKDTDWNVITVPGTGVNNRQIKLSRGKFLGGSSGVNGTLCIRGSKQDYDDWGLPGWSGEEMFGYMRKVWLL